MCLTCVPVDALDSFFYKAQTKQTCHITASKVNDMTWLTTNNKCLNLVISLKFDRLQNISLTKTGCHDNATSIFCLTSSPTMSHFPDLSLVTKLQQPLFQLSHWSPGHMVHYNPLLVHYHSRNLYNLACLCMPRSLIYTTTILLDFVEICFYSTLPHYICFITVFPCSYLMHFVSKPDHLRDYLC